MWHKFVHKPTQVELQLDRPQLPYLEILGPIIAGGSPAHYCRRQPNPTRKGPHKDQFMLLKLYNEIKILKKTFKTKHVVYWMNNQLNDTSLAPSTYRKIIFVLIMCNVHYLFNPTNQVNHMHCTWRDTSFFYWFMLVRAQSSNHVWSQTFFN